MFWVRSFVIIVTIVITISSISRIVVSSIFSRQYFHRQETFWNGGSWTQQSLERRISILGHHHHHRLVLVVEPSGSVSNRWLPVRKTASMWSSTVWRSSTEGTTLLWRSITAFNSSYFHETTPVVSFPVCFTRRLVRMVTPPGGWSRPERIMGSSSFHRFIVVVIDCQYLSCISNCSCTMSVVTVVAAYRFESHVGG